MIPDISTTPPKKLHITILGQIDAGIGFQVLTRTLKATLLNYRLKFKIIGVASNNSGASFIAYPEGFSIYALRQELREKLGVKTDDYTRYLSSYEYVGWINFLRYKAKPASRFLKYLNSKGNTHFGEVDRGKIVLMRNSSRLLRKGKYKVIYTTNLS